MFNEQFMKYDNIQIDRIRYIVSSYLRTRIQKIEKYAHSLIAQQENLSEEDDPIMSHEELKYAKQ